MRLRTYMYVLLSQDASILYRNAKTQSSYTDKLYDAYEEKKNRRYNTRAFSPQSNRCFEQRLGFCLRKVRLRRMQLTNRWTRVLTRSSLVCAPREWYWSMSQSLVRKHHVVAYRRMLLRSYIKQTVISAKHCIIYIVYISWLIISWLYY